MPINVEYWSLQYSAREDDESTYEAAMQSHSAPLERARALWDWKDLSRGVDVEAVTTVVSNDELAALTERDPSDAVATLSDRLVDRGALANRTVVTPAFLLHLADSGPHAYSPRFPIFDARCWVAFAYLSGDRTGDESLPASATASADRFGEFSEFFQKTLPDSVNGRKYEQALFRFGSYVSSLPADTVDEVDAHLLALEKAVTTSHDRDGFALVQTSNDTDRV
ncbi:hypothetical protein [Halobacterium sp. R2-5]|uniref:hypothetical protein n=1 Tax=Halobacterium sp. R2-5 TaxID=2715751 RepID=UPI00141FE210|nr:hypothetical protein [Halobacterium sp. R2-5]NIC00933.1 hypothetical protein [Halobacterium sp. R2-5]